MLTQTEAQALIAMRKAFVNAGVSSIPVGVDETHELIGSDPRERFFLDIWRGTLRLTKLKFQTRGRRVIVLVRLDIDGAPHTNPDGQRIDGAHLHVYREGYEDKWASPVDSNEFRNPLDTGVTFEDFCRYCNIEDNVSFEGELL